MRNLRYLHNCVVVVWGEGRISAQKVLKMQKNGVKISSWPEVTKPVFAAQNGVKSYDVYIFLAKDLHIWKKCSNFAAKFDKPRNYGQTN